MQLAKVQRGALLLGSHPGPRFWLLWHDGARPVCLPIAGQSMPLTRWHYRLRRGDAPGLTGQALIVCCDEAARLNTDGMVVLGAMAGSAVAAVEQAIKRALASVRAERR